MERSPSRKSTSCSTSHEMPFRLFYNTRRFNYAFQKVQYRSLSQARLNQFTSPNLNTTKIYVIEIKHITEWRRLCVAGLCQSCTLTTDWINTPHFFFLIVVPCILVTLKFLSPTNAPFYWTYKMLKCTVKNISCLLLHVSVHLDHLQGAYA